MKDVYTEARANKGNYDMNRLCDMIEKAYQDALEDVLCYLDDEERWAYLEANETCGGGSRDFSVYDNLYMNFFYESESHKKPFDIAQYAYNIWGSRSGRPNFR